MMNQRLSEKEKEALRDIFLVLENDHTIFDTFLEAFRYALQRFKMLFFVKPLHAC
jgi:hypothetical protein